MNPLFAIDAAGQRRMVWRTPGILDILDVGRDGRTLISRVNHKIPMHGGASGQTVERSLSWHDVEFANSLSADGSMFAFSETGDAGGRVGTIYVRKTDGSPVIALGEGKFGSLSPDKKWVAAERPPNVLVLLPTASGQAQIRTLDRFETMTRAVWLPDGRRLLVAAREPGHAVRLYTYALETGEFHAITNDGFDLFDTGSPISTDGTRVAAADRDGVVRIVMLDGSAPPRGASGLEPGQIPAGWSSDSKSLFVFRRGELPARVYRTEIETGRSSLWKELRPRDSAGVVGIVSLNITPDGKFYVYSYVQYVSDLYVVEGLK